MGPYKNLPIVPRVIFGLNSVLQIESVLENQFGSDQPTAVYILDPALQNLELLKLLPNTHNSLVIWADLSTEPTTWYVDELVQQIKEDQQGKTDVIVGIGGGSVMDIAKSVSLLLKNPGSAKEYQGWDLIKNPGVFHIGIPSLAGSGAEVSRTAVLIGPEKKLGINSDYTPFDQIILDPTLTASAPTEQAFYTAMDCYIHCTESLNGTLNNQFSNTYAEKARDLCEEVFLKECSGPDDKMVMASYFGGLSIGYSQVGICHALSYGLSYGIGMRHGLANCVIFKHLREQFPREVKCFNLMLDRHEINLPSNLSEKFTNETIEKMTSVAMNMEPLWQNTFGKQWKSKITRKYIEDFYKAL